MSTNELDTWSSVPWLREEVLTLRARVAELEAEAAKPKPEPEKPKAAPKKASEDRKDQKKRTGWRS